MSETAESPNPVSQQLAAIQTQLQQHTDQLNDVKAKIAPLQNLPEQVSQIEKRQLAIGDLCRYEHLQNYLTQHRWYEADQETIQLIQDIEGVTKLEYITPDRIRSFPCAQL